MYDTINIRLLQGESDVNFLQEIPLYLDTNTKSYHEFQNGKCIMGKLGNLSVSASDKCLRIGNGSLCKYLHGNNYQTLTRLDTKMCLEKIEDALHLSLGKADVMRMDVGGNMVMQHSPDVYFKHLGELKGYARYFQKGSLYYNKTTGMQLCFYDKNREQKQKHNEIPIAYQNKHVLRYEQRYERKAIKVMGGKCCVTASMLYDDVFFSCVCKKWQETYEKIEKIKEIEPNFEAMKTKKDLEIIGVITLVERFGGEQTFLELIKELQERKEIDRKEAYKIRTWIKKALKSDKAFVKKNEVIAELNSKVRGLWEK